MPSSTHEAGSLGRQIAFALAAAVVAAVVGTAQGLVPTLIDLSTGTVWLISAAGALSSLVAALVAGAAGYAAGLGDADAGTVVRTAVVFAGAGVVALSAAAVAFGVLAPNASVTPPLAAAAGVAGRTVPFVAGGVAGAALSRARSAPGESRDASYSAHATNDRV